MKVQEIINKGFAKVADTASVNVKEPWKCKFCPKIYSYHMTRMRKHLEECRGTPTWLKDLAGAQADTKALKRPGLINDIHGRNENSEPPSKKQLLDNRDIEKSPPLKEVQPSRKRESNINTFCDTMTERENEYLQKELARVIYATGSPLNLTENPYWISFFAKLRPSFKLPNRDQVSNKYLNEINDEVKSEVEKKVSAAKFLGVQFDVWSNIRNEGVVNVILTTPKPVFYESIATTVERQTGQYLAGQIGQIIEQVGASKILTVCTDSSSANKLAWVLLKERYPHIFTYGCVAHILDLLLQDIGKIQDFERLITNCKSIVKEIKFSKQLLAKFTEIQKRDLENVKITLKIPGQTRFGSNIITMESLRMNKENLQALAIDKAASNMLKPITRKILLEEEIWNVLDLILPLMKPVGTWITLLESDSPNLGHIVEVFAELKSHFENSIDTVLNTILRPEDCERMLQCLENRKVMALTDLHWAANILDPSFKGKNLTVDEYTAGSQVIVELAEYLQLDENVIISELAQFTAESGFWASNVVRQAGNLVDASTYWAGICKKTTLSSVGEAIQGMLSTSTSTERSFKTEAWIHDDRRNRLTRERASKIAFIAHNTRLLQEKSKKKKGGKMMTENEESDDDFTDFED